MRDDLRLLFGYGGWHRYRQVFILEYALVYTSGLHHNGLSMLLLASIRLDGLCSIFIDLCELL